jgi:hypothetical protein
VKDQPLSEKLQNTLMAPDKARRENKILRHFPPGTLSARASEIVGEAFERYVVRGESAEEIAEAMPDAPARLVRRLVRAMGWNDRREQHLLELQTASAIRYAKTVERYRDGVVTAVAGEDTSALLGSLVAQMKRTLEPDDGEAGKYAGAAVRRLAEAYKQIADVALSAVNISGEMPELAALRRKAEGGGAGKQPWLSVHAAGPVTISSGRGGPEESGGEETLDAEYEEAGDDYGQDVQD